MIPRVLVSVALLVCALSLTGCGIFGDPQEQANDAISAANESITEHNRNFQAARDTYAEVKERVEDGRNPADQRERVAEARRSLRDARSSLQEARASLAEVEDLDVDPAVKRYARLLSEAMGAQLDAEQKEIEFYDLLEGDPALEDNREEALDLLSEVGDGYERAERSYAEARELANDNPRLIQGPNGGGSGNRSGDES